MESYLNNAVEIAREAGGLLASSSSVRTRFHTSSRPILSPTLTGAPRP